MDSLFSKEIVITIPQEFLNNQYPLPPFPQEAINTLPQEDIDTELMDRIEVRSIGISEIDYGYYPYFLKSSLNSETLISLGSTIKSDYNSISPGIFGEYINNGYLLSGGISYLSDRNLPYIEGRYHEYRLPLYIDLDGDTNQTVLELGYKDYYKSWSITPVIFIDRASIYLSYYNKNGLKPYIDSGFKAVDKRYTSLAYGSESLRLGLSNIDSLFLPYLDISKKVDRWLIELNSDIEGDIINRDDFSWDYNIGFTRREESVLRFGSGTFIDSKYNPDPYIFIKENYFPGERSYRVSEDEICFTTSFIKDDLASIISLTVTDFKEWDIGMELDFSGFTLSSGFLLSDKPEISFSYIYKVD